MHAREIEFGVDLPCPAEEEFLECPRRARTRWIDDSRQGNLHEKSFRARNRYQLEVPREYPRPVGNEVVLRERGVRVAARDHLREVAMHDAEASGEVGNLRSEQGIACRFSDQPFDRGTISRARRRLD